MCFFTILLRVRRPLAAIVAGGVQAEDGSDTRALRASQAPCEPAGWEVLVDEYFRAG